MADNVITRAVDRFISGLGYTKAQRSEIALFGGVTPMGSGLNYDAFSEAQLERLAALCSWVYSDVSAIGKEASSAEFEIVKMSEERETHIVDHPFERIMRRPNPAMGQGFLVRYLIWWLKLRGEAYIWKVTNAMGELTELWPIPSNLIQPIPDARDYVSGFSYMLANGERVVVPVEEICYIRYPNPFDYHRGLADLHALKAPVLTDLAAQRWNRETFNQGGTLPSIIGLPPDLSSSVFQQAKADIVDELKSGSRFIIGRTGQVNVQHLAATQRELEFLAGREFNREEIDRVFGIPAGYWAKDANRANIQGAKATMIDNAVWPDLRLIGSEFTAQIVRQFYGDGFVGRYQDIRPKDRLLEMREYQAYSLDRTIDENREAQGLKPLGRTGLTDIPIRLLSPNALATLNQGPSGRTAQPGAESGAGEPDAEMQEDLKRWQSIELRRLKRGDKPGYDFESESIPAHVKAAVLAGLAGVTTDGEVRAAFAAGFCPSARMEEYPYP